MTTTKIQGTTVLTASEGKRLTNGKGLYANELWLGVNDSPDNYSEVDIADVPPADAEIIE